MKLIKWILLLTIISCASKYETHHFIDKRSFKLGKAHTTVNPRKLPSHKETNKFCASQWFFTKNADKIVKASVPALLTSTCPGKTHLLKTKVTESFWTTIIYSRSCVKIETMCPK